MGKMMDLMKCTLAAYQGASLRRLLLRPLPRHVRGNRRRFQDHLPVQCQTTTTQEVGHRLDVPVHRRDGLLPDPQLAQWPHLQAGFLHLQHLLDRRHLRQHHHRRERYRHRRRFPRSLVMPHSNQCRAEGRQ